MERREFLKSMGAAAAGSALLSGALTSCASIGSSGRASGRLTRGTRILFQGDSITDAGRSRDNTGANEQPALGNGYAWLAATALLVDQPEAELQIYNRGVSGNKVFQLAERWDKDCLELKPDVLSILIGVNDLWHKLNGQYNGDVQKYEGDYKALLTRTKHALPKVRLVICEPFVLRCGAVSDKWFPEFDEYRAAAKRVAQEFRATFVPFQSMFDRAVRFAPAEHWAKDGVHPSGAGASLMASEWNRLAHL